MEIRGFLLLVIGVGLVTFALAKRSVALITPAAVGLGLALLSNLYGVENQTDRFTATTLTTTQLPNLLLPSAFLLVAGAVVGWRTRRRRSGGR